MKRDAAVAILKACAAELRRRFGISEVIGETAKRVPSEIRDEIAGVPWRAIAGFRDLVAHVYFALDDAIVWNAVRAEVPSLLIAVRAYLAK